MEKGRIRYFDYLKVIALLFMIMIHVSIYYLNSHTPLMSGWMIANIFDSISRVCVPIFVMISGALMLDLERKCSIRSVYMKVGRLAISYTFWSFIYAVVDNLIKYKTVNINVFYHIVGETIVGHYHMWYVWMIAWLYILTPIFRLICRNRLLLKYYIFLSLIFTFLVNYLLTIGPVSATLRALLSNMNITFITSYSGYYMLGYYFSKEQEWKKYKGWIYFLGIIGMFMTFLKTYWLSVQAGTLVETFYAYLMPNVLFASIAFFCFMQCKDFTKVSLNKFAIESSKISLGIYLSHNLFIILFEKKHILDLPISLIILIPAISILVFCLSFLLSKVISYIPKIGKLLV